MISRWENGHRSPEPAYQEKLCSLFEKSAIELGFIEQPERDEPSEHVYTNIRLQDEITTPLELSPSASSSNEEEEDMNRRQTLKNIGIAGIALLSGSLPMEFTEEVEKLLNRKVARMQKWVLDSLEDGTRLRWQLYYTSSNTLTEEGLLNQISKLEFLADEGDLDYHKAHCLLIQNYQLAGSLARDNFHYTRAKEYFRKAQQLAKETQSPDMLASSIARYALVLMRQEQPQEALEYYQEAASVAKHAEPYIRAYVFSGLAEAHARNGNSKDCYTALDQAESLLDRMRHIPLEEDMAYVRLRLQSLQDTRGECYSLLGQPLKGLEYLKTAHQQVNTMMSRNHCRLLMQQSEAYLAAELPDQCVEYAINGLQIARTIQSAGSINWTNEIYDKLLQSPWKNEAVVDQLKQAIHS